MLTEKSNVTGEESVDVSYPNFIEDMRKLHAVIRSMPNKE
jgi:5-enolpyruvylshikimate-3-phosphate synthase